MIPSRFSNVIVVVSGLLLTSAAYFLVSAWEDQIVESEFERHAINHAVDLQGKIDLHVEILESIAGLLRASNNIDRGGFREFVTPILERYPEVQGYSWNPLVSNARRSDYEEMAKQEGIAGFSITEFNQAGDRLPAQQRDEYVPVYYLEPLAGNEEALGFDIASEPIRRMALTEARQTGKATTTQWVKLVQEKEQQFGILMVRPIYERKGVNNSYDQVNEQLAGYVVGVFRVGDMIEEALRPSEPAGLDFWVYQGSEPAYPAMSYFHPSRSREAPTGSRKFEQTELYPGNHYVQTLQLPGKTWTIIYKAAPALLKIHSQYTANGILVAGLALTALLSFYTFVVRRRAELSAAHNRELEHKIVEREKAEVALRESESYNRMLFEKSAIGLVLSDIEGNLIDINNAFASILGMTVQEAKQLNYWDITAAADAHNEREQFSKLQQVSHYGPYEKQYIHKDGTLVPVRQTGRSLQRGKAQYIWSSVEDITHYKKARERIEHLAFHDPLTDLPNRKLLHDRLEHACKLASRNETFVAVLFLDVDRFKTINDSLGHKVGDLLLIQISGRLSKTVRQSDTVARFGGDEFVIVAEGLSSKGQAEELAKSVIQSFAQPFQVGIHQLYTSTSIGIALSCGQDTSAEDLISQADIAMYGAKDAGRNRLQFHLAEMGQSVAAKADMERDLRGALERDEFLVYLQPITDLNTLKTAGFEALMRWQHPKRGLVSPGEFIPILDDTGMIVPASRWILAESCRILSHFQQQQQLPISIGVNLSAPCFYDSGLASFVQQTLQSYSLKPHNLVLEITESTLFHDPRGVRPTMDHLKEIGVRIALDDFGTGQSSLNHLRKFPIDIVKIDREFVRNIPDDDNDCELVSAIVAMSHKLNMTVVAEGVEQESQLQYLKDLDCDKVQGFLFSPPRPVSEASEYLKQHS